ncbi:KTSC domain-containing protein [Chryseobacterium phosphatilyticum]|uniref:KTSC domain-containing protein n=1 Tax=Chryseobacterium phosphatilyticum TaxID=475075 RepID=A0A316X7U6_9FLAO|nr:KTSC domain-containing protein [Chryseobacterium phosphatilyticum]PWN69835.1 KTSC domain-containing protein [Chryseobacterium phosphatilyticum]
MPSSVVNHFIYFPQTEILRIIYQSGSVYDYLQVPADIVEKFAKARSRGSFLNKVIKPGYKYIKIS